MLTIPDTHTHTHTHTCMTVVASPFGPTTATETVCPGAGRVHGSTAADDDDDDDEHDGEGTPF